MSITLRDAQPTDLPDLTALRPPEAAHRGRLRDSQDDGFQYLVVNFEQQMIGFVCLVYSRPQTWSDPDDKQYLPQIVDLYLAEAWRGQGYGSQAIHVLEHIAGQRGHNQLYIAVEPQTNPRAFALYQRLGYRPIYSEPRQQTWKSTDGDGKIQSGEGWFVHLVKSLN